jgi:carboxymethylenebutenolidase
MTEDFLAAAEWLKARPDSKASSVPSASALVEASSTFWPCGWVPIYGGRAFLRKSAQCGRYRKDQRRRCLRTYGELDTRNHVRAAGFRQGAHGGPRRASGLFVRGANHGFHNDTTPRYDEPAAKLAWQRTLDWFNKYLR